ncbi:MULTISPECIES: threo-3-hydroxy-L-aspartate ammonia-lyase [Proteus]|uniref:Threo-3-hydroxy-L-aspartate ammonia-lyase n=1 Tax=Proteus terrae subsp. cibarius TaxID=626774 RepID=A0A6G6S5K3_9GAMM|nr:MULTISPECIES: threo-3-hydroxy-L-aspartate ammonia-lyase [Proteus]MBG2914597.1 threo-3-hydroxy-L-aspartate ammonia-lyase [Proteus terrae subsp. cibarius]MBG3090064.1 threo-3-hydroxy-L-aspartate ammonia-lyase [Proteus terrae subsp. cibarius]MCM2366188.1 threo-3-hydroxy-L-aspartate ammonia-lyase [Proteus sp. FZP2095]MCO4180626.1 threo-3-hydroxy-L-aspartate ammonia-lyase [Proteus terrae]MCO4189614.1 threo-3-hydroxy-L-aspartate ammonia-lyase [Proteus terrae]
MNKLSIPTYKDVAEAHQRILPYLNKTPVLTSRTINELTGAQFYFKCENFQRMGAFKFRGAMNALSQFNDQQRKNGVVTFSSGNHAQAIALSAKLLGIPATIIMPEDAPKAKMEATKGYGGRVITYNRYTEDREEIGQQLAQKEGLTLIPPYDHPHIIAGQGTAAKELFDEVGELDMLFVPLGGGGLLSGSLLSTKALSPDCKVFGIEPLAGNDGQQSLRKGEIIHIDTPKTIADGAQTQHLGNYTFEIIRNNVDDILTATDEELISAMQFYAQRMKIIVEPTGCLSLAAARQFGDKLKGKKIGIIISGGNVDIAQYGHFLAQ